ncbi:LuxR family transcriptional regulator [Streptomyces sp. V4-01]|uniref:LuxR family transcriptional regulator n=1 Tax=Actinacidiphila polyblastidii TaxID=3110430 RepID=A0ABU7P9F8_9ACTN|nr:LuxR family transcriptional regulator [Streptomyces sp. V4-01]
MPDGIVPAAAPSHPDTRPDARAAGHRRRTPPALTGRAELLAAARDRLRERHGLLLRGPAGIGKSTLLAAVAAEDVAAGATVLRCTPAPEDAALPYLGLIDLFARVPHAVIDALPPAPRAALRGALLHGAAHEPRERGADGLEHPEDPHPWERAPAPPTVRESGGALAVRVAVLEALRPLAARGPVVLVVDGLQWLDRPTADVLAFVARRIDDEDIRIVAAERPPGPPAAARPLPSEAAGPGPRAEGVRCLPPDTAVLDVPPLADDDVALLLLSTGVAPPPPVLRAVLRTAAGNPYYALELARGAPAGELSADHGGLLPVPGALRDRLLAGVRALPYATRHALLVASVAAAPTTALLRAAGATGAGAAAAAGEGLGVLTVEPSQALRFTHPVLRAAVHADASPAERRLAHARLAAAVADPAGRARHAALARPEADEATAADLTTAAHAARGRGAPDAAAELALLAARRTPRESPADRDRRLLAAAGFACDAGHREESEQAAREVLAGSASARLRVQARLVLLRNAGQALQDAAGLIEDGLRDAAGAPDLEAALYHWAALRGLLGGALEEAAEHARRSDRCAAAAGDADTRIAALSTLARVRSLAGEPGDAEEALSAALALVLWPERFTGARREASHLAPRAEPGPEPEPDADADAEPSEGARTPPAGPAFPAAALAGSGPQGWGLVRLRAVLALDADRVGQAAGQLTGLLAATGGVAGVEPTVAALVALTRVQVKAGECREALRTAARCTAVVADAGAMSAPALYAAALAETFGGDAERALRLAARAVRASEADGDRLFLLRALAVHGQAALFAGDRPRAAGAVESLRRVAEIGASMGAADPPLLGWHADLAEALAMLGEHDAAGAVLREARRKVTGRTPGSTLAALDRAAGLRAAAAGRSKDGVALLTAAVDRLRPSALPVDLVRALTALGTVERRARHRTAARAALTEAAALAGHLGAAPLALRAADELARVDGAVAAAGSGATRLTPAEARVARLVSGGATNREVAAELFISVKTVEGTLSRLYRRFGVRSRTALAHMLATAPLSPPQSDPAAAADPSADADRSTAADRSTDRAPSAEADVAPARPLETLSSQETHC